MKPLTAERTACSVNRALSCACVHAYLDEKKSVLNYTKAIVNQQFVLHSCSWNVVEIIWPTKLTSMI